VVSKYRPVGSSRRVGEETPLCVYHYYIVLSAAIVVKADSEHAGS